MEEVLHILYAVEWKALGLILMDEEGARGEDSLQSLGRRWEALAHEAVKSLIVEVDLNDDGEPDFPIRLGRVKVRRA